MAVECPGVPCAGLQAIVECSGASPPGEEALRVGDSLKPLVCLLSFFKAGTHLCLPAVCGGQTPKVVLDEPI